jgi:hypothetical protein
MADISEIPYSSRAGGDSPPAAGRETAGGRPVRAAVAVATVVAGSALLGVAAGLAWTAVAPPAPLRWALSWLLNLSKTKKEYSA